MRQIHLGLVGEEMTMAMKMTQCARYSAEHVTDTVLYAHLQSFEMALLSQGSYSS